MTTRTWFSTAIYAAPLTRTNPERLRKDLLEESYRIRDTDLPGQKWSQKSYPGGYTSYSSMSRLHRFSSTFEALEKRIRRHVLKFADELDYDLEGRELAMTDCWVNIMPKQTTHGLHIHPLSTISGTYYVKTPKGCSSIKFEDPRLTHFMAAPPRKSGCRPENRQFVEYPVEAGNVILFESWLRHEVPPNPVKGERVSISFNYNWF
jgi:uncharacterized protein (TIGR02466 family)